MCSSTQPGRNRRKFPFGAVTLGLALCAGSALSCAQKSATDPANSARWQNYLKDNASETKTGAAAYQRRQAELAKKRAGGGAVKTETSAATAHSTSGKTSPP